MTPADADATVPGQSRPGRRTFGPVVALGVAGSGLTAYVSTREWASVDAVGDTPLSSLFLRTDDLGGQMPLVTALSLVALAAWGVLLVSRGWVRRAVAILGLLASAAALMAAISAWRTLPAHFEELFADNGLDVQPDVSWSAWFPIALVTATVAVLAAIAAVLWCRRWPEMGTKYDAPDGGKAADPAASDRPEDLWKALDEGHDPTQ